MEDDGCPRLAPPPKPTLQEMTQAKPVVPEVSLLLSGYDNSVQKEVSAQTVPSEPLLETRSIGVNTDISWSELVASIRNDNNNNSNSTPHSPPLIRTNRCINNDLRPNNNNNRQTLNQETTLDHFTRHNNNNSNNIQTTHNNNNNNNRQTLNRQTNQNENEDEEEEEEENGQLLVHRDPTTTNILTSREQEEEEEEQEKEFQALHPPLPLLIPKQLLPSHVVSCVGASGGGSGNSSPLHTLRNVGNEGVSQEAAHCVMLRDSVATSHPGNQTDVPSPGRNFYDNILANIQHILQNSDAANEITQQQQQQQQQLDHPQQSAPQRERRPLGESHVEALREQLIQFGISFMEPGTHTDQPQGTMDTMYLPRVHNMLSMYQSAISTHYHPGQPRLDATTAKYLTDSQLAAIAAKSSVTVSQDASRRTQVTNSHSPSTNTNTTQEEAAAASQLYRFTVSNNVSMSSINFLEKYGLKEDQ
ncbi:hypothetical protein Pmani_022619 [Petrolisthes manimaculis]|uniref:Uncharacterized protein n=1 Tax=Petrolisthes manimaculis TaxID=1843537 RepID=A0AAE1PDK3_9EUCA|nr:hypothetical protein Pmani_022619 [Petrolisthes manimaculis]